MVRKLSLTATFVQVIKITQQIMARSMLGILLKDYNRNEDFSGGLMIWMLSNTKWDSNSRISKMSVTRSTK